MKTLREIKRSQTLAKYKEIYDKVQSGIPLKSLWKPYKYASEASLRSTYNQSILPLYKNS